MPLCDLGGKSGEVKRLYVHTSVLAQRGKEKKNARKTSPRFCPIIALVALYVP